MEAGFFAYSKMMDRWVQISKISTADAKFGRYFADDSEAKKRLQFSQVVWDFTKFAALDYIEQPLCTSGSIEFPDSVSYDETTGKYELRYLSAFRAATAETVLYFKRSDLIQGFKKTAR
jgi:hypothetical protein